MASKRVIIVSILQRLLAKKTVELRDTCNDRAIALLRIKAQEILDAKGEGATVDGELEDLAEQFDDHLAYIQAMPKVVRRAIYHYEPNTENPFRSPGAVKYLVPPSPHYSHSFNEYVAKVEQADKQTLLELKDKIDGAELKLAFGADLDKVKDVLLDLGFDPKEVGL